jgi:hypothetical protein
MIMIRLRRFFLPLLLPFTSASYARSGFFRLVWLTTKMVKVLFLRSWSPIMLTLQPGLPINSVALDRETSEMEADNRGQILRTSRLRIQTQAATHRFRGYRLSYNLFVLMGMPNCL